MTNDRIRGRSDALILPEPAHPENPEYMAGWIEAEAEGLTYLGSENVSISNNTTNNTDAN